MFRFGMNETTRQKKELTTSLLSWPSHSFSNKENRTLGVGCTFHKFSLSLFTFCFGKKTNNDINEGSFLLHETTKLAILVFLAKKTSNTQRTKNHETWSTLLNKQRERKPPTFLLGKKQSTLKLAILILANKGIENNQLFLLARDPKTSNNQNTS